MKLLFEVALPWPPSPRSNWEHRTQCENAPHRLNLQAWRTSLHFHNQWHFHRASNHCEYGNERGISSRRVSRHRKGMFCESPTYSHCRLRPPDQVYRIVPALQDPKPQAHDRIALPEQARSISKWSSIKGAFLGYVRHMSEYCHHRAFLPSFSGAILYFTVLNFAGQMVTYLLASGYNSYHVGAARTLSVAFEIAATWTAPLFMSKVGPIRAGIWSVNFQLFCLAGAAGLFWGARDPMVAATGLVVGTILSRVGLRGFDLCSQIIVQEASQPFLLWMAKSDVWLTCFWH
jgi:hypothetical protein